VKNVKGQTSPTLEVNALSFSYGSYHPVFEDVSFSVQAGEVLVLLGPNGCGKTTLLNCIAGLLRSPSGHIQIEGLDSAQLSPVQRALHMSYLPQIQDTSFDFTVIDYVVMGCAPRLRFGRSPGRSEYLRAQELLERLDVASLANTSCSHISGGERQQAQIARVLMQDTALILMDEPTNHLDYGNQIKMLRMIDNLIGQGHAILMTSHVPDHAIMLDGSVAIINREGAFSSGAVSEVLDAQLLENLYGERIALHWMDEYDRSVCVPECVCTGKPKNPEY
jgi:iron complex transport system ATP-binding protein